MKKSAIALLIFLIQSFPFFGITVKKIGAENGLSNNNVVSIAQDREGFIWICTKDGLNRFDGNKFQVFKNSKNDPNSICSNVLNYVYADKSEDVVWIASEKNGLDSYNYKTHEFTHFRHKEKDKNSLSANGITHITADNKGNIWLATYSTGIELIEKRTHKITHYNQSNVKGLVSNYNWYVLEDNGERLYVGHVTNGLSIIDLKTRTAVNFTHNPADPNSLCDVTVTCIFKDSHNRIWVGTRNGLTLFDPFSYKMINFRRFAGNPNSLSGNFIKSMVETKDHKLWIGTEDNGISILDMNQLNQPFIPEKVVFQHIGESNTDEGLSGTSVQALIQDSFGNFWSGGFIGGVNFISNRNQFFNKISYQPFLGNYNSLANTSVLGVCADANDKLWVANGAGGISVYDKQNKIKSFQATKPMSASAVCMDFEHNIWIGTSYGQLYKYNSKSQSFTSINLVPYPNTPIYSIYNDSKNRIWAASDAGLYIIDTKSMAVKVVNPQNSELNDINVRAFQEDKYGNMWVGKLVGALQVFDPNMNLLADLGSRYDFYAINQIYKDSENRIWVCTQNDLFLFTSEQKPARRFGKNEGLAENFIMSVTEGKHAGELWLSTINGISFLDIKTGKVLNFNVADDIAAGDYTKGAVTKTRNGDIYFGSQHGVTFFNQNSTDEQNINVKPQVTSLFVADKSKQHLTDFQNMPFSEKTELNYTQNSFQLNFNVLDFSLNNKVEFMYQMSGLDNNWYYIGKEKQVTFRNLRPGKYVFHIKARIQNKEWSDNEAVVTLIVHPPFWLTWWAKTFYLLVTLLITLYGVRFYKKRLELENSLILEKRNHEQEHHLNEEKMKFFTNIAHELRTPMTLIIGPLEDIVADKALPKAFSEKLKSIHRVANRLLDLINQILEFRKTETNNRVLKVKKTNLIPHVYEIGLRYKELYQKKNVDFNIKLPAHPVDIYFDADVISLILDNLISNAFKYTPQGSISVEVRETTEGNVDYAEILVSDTGIGISAEDIPYIFNRYYQAQNRSAQMAGTGIGLSLVKNLVDLHEAEISVRSEINTGTTFSVRLLLNNSYANAIHVESIEKQEDGILELERNGKQMILVVEDNAEIVGYICSCLEDTYELITASDGKTGYEIACEKTPDIIISDIMMPVMDGIQFCKNIKQNVLTSHIPVILLTAKSTLQDKTEGYDAGADSYMTKPFSGNLLKSRVKNLLLTRPKLNDTYNSFKNKKMILHESASNLDKEFIEKLTNLIEQNIENEELSIAQIASMLNMSHSSLYRKIKALTDLNVNEFIRKVRMKVAEQLILTNKYSVNEIMYRVGMNSVGYFRECFKDEFGVSPSEYIQKLKE